MAGKDKLRDYRVKRDVRRSGEPAGGGRAGGGSDAGGGSHARGDGAGGGLPRFVVHKHDASTLHYDVRRRNSVSTQPASVRSGRTNEDLEKAEAKGET